MKAMNMWTVTYWGGNPLIYYLLLLLFVVVAGVILLLDIAVVVIMVVIGGFSFLSVEDMQAYVDAGLTTFDMADIYGPAEEIFGQFNSQVHTHHSGLSLTPNLQPPTRASVKPRK